MFRTLPQFLEPLCRASRWGSRTCCPTEIQMDAGGSDPGCLPAGTDHLAVSVPPSRATRKNVRSGPAVVQTRGRGGSARPPSGASGRPAVGVRSWLDVVEPPPPADERPSTATAGEAPWDRRREQARADASATCSLSGDPAKRAVRPPTSWGRHAVSPLVPRRGSPSCSPPAVQPSPARAHPSPPLLASARRRRGPWRWHPRRRRIPFRTPRRGHATTSPSTPRGRDLRDDASTGPPLRSRRAALDWVPVPLAVEVEVFGLRPWSRCCLKGWSLPRSPTSQRSAVRRSRGPPPVDTRLRPSAARPLHQAGPPPPGASPASSTRANAAASVEPSCTPTSWAMGSSRVPSSWAASSCQRS